MQQAFTIGLTIFYVLWLLAVLYFLYRIAQAVQKAANAIHAFAGRGREADDYTG